MRVFSEAELQIIPNAKRGHKCAIGVVVPTPSISGTWVATATGIKPYRNAYNTARRLARRKLDISQAADWEIQGVLRRYPWRGNILITLLRWW